MHNTPSHQVICIATYEEQVNIYHVEHRKHPTLNEEVKLHKFTKGDVIQKQHPEIQTLVGVTSS